jgi:hypothetical protein
MNRSVIAMLGTGAFITENLKVLSPGQTARTKGILPVRWVRVHVVTTQWCGTCAYRA